MDVVEELRSRHGVDPDVVGSAPGRVNVIGEHLDYNGGLALPLALPCRTTVAVARRDDGRLVVESLQSDDPASSLLPVHAPISGRVVEKHATLGELATPESTLFIIGDLGHVWIWIDVYERDLAGVHLDDGVEVTVESYPGRVFSGEVTYLSPAVAAETRTVRARIDVENPEGLLRPGMFADVRLIDPHTEAAAASLVVPDGAIVRSGGDTFVFVPAPEPGGEHAGARFEARPVTVGRHEGGWVEIRSGVEAGEEVVTEGAFFLESELAREELGGGHAH